MTPGSRWVYSEKDTEGKRERVVVEVTDETKMIANGIEARVIRDTVSEKGVPVEVTHDWYAQDEAGNIWYLGEYVTNYENDSDVLMTRDLVPLEPRVQELKFYARDVGPVLSVHIDGAGGRAELVSYTPGR